MNNEISIIERRKLIIHEDFLTPLIQWAIMHTHTHTHTHTSANPLTHRILFKRR
jgi:hypothetical protein